MLARGTRAAQTGQATAAVAAVESRFCLAKRAGMVAERGVSGVEDEPPATPFFRAGVFVVVVVAVDPTDLAGVLGPSFLKGVRAMLLILMISLLFSSIERTARMFYSHFFNRIRNHLWKR